MRLTETIHHSGRVVIIDSGVCVLKALTKLASIGVYSSTVMKKRRYWPKYIGRVIILNSGICVLKTLAKLASVGVYSSALIKKRRYWPNYIRGDDIDKRFANTEVGVVACHAGNITTWEIVHVINFVHVTFFCYVHLTWQYVDVL